MLSQRVNLLSVKDKDNSEGIWLIYMREVSASIATLVMIGCAKHDRGKIKQGDFGFFSVLYSTLLHLSPLRFHCVGGC